MAKANVPAKDVERDEVAESLQGVVQFLERNYIKLIVLAIAIAAAVLFKISYDNRQQRAQRQLNNKINQVLAEMIAIERTIDPQQRDQRIETLAVQIDQMIGRRMPVIHGQVKVRPPGQQSAGTGMLPGQ